MPRRATLEMKMKIEYSPLAIPTSFASLFFPDMRDGDYIERRVLWMRLTEVKPTTEPVDTFGHKIAAR
jgi:hypothetical protein